MLRVIDNETFLTDLFRAKSKDAKLLISNCTQEELKSIVECIINSSSKYISKEDKQTFTSLMSFFRKKTVLGEQRLRLHLIKHSKQLKSLICKVFSQVINIELACNILTD